MAPGQKSKPRTSNPTKDTVQEVEKKINSRKFLREREFTKTPKYEFYNQARARGLGKLLGKRKPGNALFVREYYLHVVCYNGGVSLRDKCFSIGRDDIRGFYHLPRVAAEDCMYKKLKDAKTDFPYKQADELVISSEDTWFAPNNHERYLARADLNPEAKCWLHLVANNIYPTSHATRLTRNLCLLIFLLKTNQSVKLEDIIYQAINACCKTHSHKLVFPHLISDIFLKAKVPQLDSNPTFKPRPAFNYNHMVSHKNPTIRQQMRDRKVKSPSPTFQQLKELHKKVDRVDSKLDKLLDLFSRLAVFQGFPMDNPGSSHTNIDAAYLLGNGEGCEDEEIHGENDGATTNTDANSQSSDDGESSDEDEDEDVGDGTGTAPMEVASGSEYDPEDD